jgi:protein-L-isoaspartate(D-aspartate) O-methyltransferase
MNATEQARFNMIQQQIRPWEVLDAQVLKLLETVKRELFVPAQHTAKAFFDVELPLGNGSVALAPKVQARLVQDLNLQPNDRVLEIGTGSGYTAALMGSMARSVLSFETDAATAAAARDALKKAGISNVEVRQADGSKGAAGDGPFDAILLGGSVAEVPQVLKDQLAPGGRLIAITGHEPMMRATLIKRVGDAGFATSQPWDTVAPRLSGFAEPSKFSF